jgi:hypothetical protein
MRRIKSPYELGDEELVAKVFELLKWQLFCPDSCVRPYGYDRSQVISDFKKHMSAYAARKCGETAPFLPGDRVKNVVTMFNFPKGIVTFTSAGLIFGVKEIWFNPKPPIEQFKWTIEIDEPIFEGLQFTWQGFEGV